MPARSVSPPGVSQSIQKREVDFHYDVSRLLAAVLSGVAALETIAELLLALPGTKAVHLRFCERAHGLFGPERLFGKLPGWGVPAALVVANLSRGGTTWGELAIYFNLADFPVASPFRLANFLAQQIAWLIARTELEQHREAVEEDLKSLHDEIALRKLLESGSEYYRPREPSV